MHIANERPPVDAAVGDIAQYFDAYAVRSASAWQAARLCLLDSLGCAFEALSYPDCLQRLGPVVPGTVVPNGARVPGTPHVLDPVQGAFAFAALVRWLDYNDAYCGRTVVHPSDCIGAILAVADWHSRTRVARGEAPVSMRSAGEAIVKAYEVMGGLALDNAYTADFGLDHVLLVKVACAAATVHLLGGTRAEIENAVSNAWIDGHTLTTFRRKPNSGPRKSWSAADAASRGVWLALLALKGEMGYPSALTAKTWGFYDVLGQGRPFTVERPYGTEVIEHAQFKVSFPAAFHAQTLAEAAIRLHPEAGARIEDVARVELWSHAYAIGILNKTGPLHNFADRDHCLQYIAAIGLVHGRLLPSDYEDAVAADPRIDALRAKMELREDPAFTRAFRSREQGNPNALRVHFRDGSSTGRVAVEYAIGHPSRRAEGLPLLLEKFEKNVARAYAARQRERILALCADAERLWATPVHEFMDKLV